MKTKKIGSWLDFIVISCLMILAGYLFIQKDLTNALLAVIALSVWCVSISANEIRKKLEEQNDPAKN